MSTAASPHVVVDAMTEADLGAVIAIDAPAFGEPPDVREAQLREELARPWARLRVARGDAGVVHGYVLFWHVADEIHVINVAVAPPARRRGIGRALVDNVIAYAREGAAAKILLEVRASNVAAIGLYAAAGFTEFNVRPRYYRDGEDAVEMMLAVT